MPKQELEIALMEDHLFGFLPGYSAEVAAAVMQAGSDSRKPPTDAGSGYLKKLNAQAILMFGEIDPYRRL